MARYSLSRTPYPACLSRTSAKVKLHADVGTSIKSGLTLVDPEPHSVGSWYPVCTVTCKTIRKRRC